MKSPVIVGRSILTVLESFIVLVKYTYTQNHFYNKRTPPPPPIAGLANEIRFCQQRNKTVMVSLGGGIGKYGFSTKEEAEGFAQTVWDMFLGGSSAHRPFNDVILDGVDLDIELGSSVYYADFVNRLRAIWRGSGKRYFVSAAPQCT